MKPFTEAIILVGGLGSRLRSVVNDVPKPLAPVAGRPFLDWLLDDLASKGFRRVILATGYGGDMIKKRYGEEYRSMAVTISRESEPLGTGGAIKLACEHITESQVMVLNGDTFAAWDPLPLLAAAQRTGAPITLGLKLLTNPDRYGTVAFEGDRVTAFREKRPVGEGLINAGLYLLLPKDIAWPSTNRFSFETDILESACGKGLVAASVMPGPFIDIGVPSAFADAQSAIPSWVTN